MADLKEEYIETIRQLVPIFSLSAQYQHELLQRSEIIELGKGKYLFKQGDRDEYSFYLLDGELELQSDGHAQSKIAGGSDSARYPLAQLQPRQLSARAKSAIKALRVNRNALDKLLVMEQDSTGTSDSMEVEVSDIGGDGDDIDWMTRILQSELFSRLPTANIHQLFAALEPVEFSKGDVVIQQGEPGDYYYILQQGNCEVFCLSSDGKDEIQLAELKPGDGFGEEALLADATRNASVRMLSDGVLMRMNKDNFLELIKKPALNSLDYGEACTRVEAGAVLIDVRLAEEYQQSHIETAATCRWRCCVPIPVNSRPTRSTWFTVIQAGAVR
ncbi:MAG: cyclic nucleotide-binding domain-containing protein [Gammaproteobacteria bacterium]|nr:cyclic nucleotide-binding domain-containing protein [Gammaproteobacteria bacterium]